MIFVEKRSNLCFNKYRFERFYRKEMTEVDEFTEAEIEEINRLLEESDERQRQNGNKTYTHEEIWLMFDIPIPTEEEKKAIKERELREYYKNQICSWSTDWFI